MVGGLDNDRFRVKRRLGARGWGMVRSPSPCVRAPAPLSLSEGAGGALGAPPTGGSGAYLPDAASASQKRMLQIPSPLHSKGTRFRNFPARKGTRAEIFKPKRHFTGDRSKRGPAFLRKFLKLKSGSLDTGLSGGQLLHAMPGDFPDQKDRLRTRPHQAADRV